jgi:hypothetical protein
MEVQEVEIFITPDGKISFEVRGVPGRRCLDLTSDLEDDLGGSVLERIETSEMDASEVEVSTKDKLFTRS